MASEIETLYKMDHPNIVTFTDVFEDQFEDQRHWCLCLVMEHIKDSELFDSILEREHFYEVKWKLAREYTKAQRPSSVASNIVTIKTSFMGISSQARKFGSSR